MGDLGGIRVAVIGVVLLSDRLDGNAFGEAAGRNVFPVVMNARRENPTTEYSGQKRYPDRRVTGVWCGMLTADSILGALAEHRERIRSHGVRRIGLFGSFARGEEREGSDIDILIEFEEGERSFDAYMDLKFFLEDLFRRRVDLVDRDTVRPALAPYILRSVRYAPGI